MRKGGGGGGGVGPLYKKCQMSRKNVNVKICNQVSWLLPMNYLMLSSLLYSLNYLTSPELGVKKVLSLTVRCYIL